MPALTLYSNVPVDEVSSSDILQEVSRTVAHHLNKPEKSVMVLLQGGVPIYCAESEEPTAYGELVSIGGIGPEKNKELSAAIAEIVEAKLSVPRLRFFIKFQDVKQEPCSENVMCLHAVHQ